jgi:hypothetical protein
LLKGQAAHAYSAPVGANSVDALFKKSDKLFNRFILVATSSMDEVLSLQESGIYNFDKSSLFKSQIEWLTFLINKAKEHSDICFIIRVHPREFPNKRDGVKSQNAEKLEKLFQSLPENVIINWPTDNISLYELIPKVDLVLTFWSSVGLEASTFGCPIIVPHNPICAYTAIADKVSQTDEQYWNDILEGINLPWNIQRVIKTIRWMWLTHFAGTISLESDTCRKNSIYVLISYIIKKILKKYNIRKLGPFINTSFAFNGHYNQVSERKINVKGESLISSQILNHENVLEDFNGLHYPFYSQNKFFLNQKNISDEKNAIRNIIFKMFKITGFSKKWSE